MGFAEYHAALYYKQRGCLGAQSDHHRVLNLSGLEEQSTKLHH